MKKKNIVISFFNQKGGVAKTTTCVNLGAKLALSGKKVLLIDLDSQHNLSINFFKKEVLKNNGTILEVFEKKNLLDEIIVKRSKNLFIAPSYKSLTSLVFDRMDIGSYYLLDKAIKNLKDNYDYILLDCPAILSEITTNAIISSDYVVEPIQTQYFSVQGHLNIKDNIEKVREYCKHLKDVYILFTIYEKRTISSNATIKSIKKIANNKNIFETMINKNISLSEAPAFQQTIFEYDSSCKGAVDYSSLAEEVIKKLV